MAVRRACRRSSAATVCRLFFTRWWISRIVASLDSSAWSRRRRSVTSRTSTSAPAASPRGRSGSARTSIAAPRAPTSMRSECRPASAVSMRAAISAASKGSSTRPRVTCGQRQPDQVAGQAHPVVRRERVGAGVGDEAHRVEPDQPVARARARVRADDDRRAGRERAVGDHLAQVGRAAEIGDLQRAGDPRHGQVGVPGEHRDDLAVVAHGDRLRAHRHLEVPARLLVAADPALDDRPAQLRVLVRRDAHADGVLGMRGGARRGAGLGDAQVRVGRRRARGIQSRKSANDMSASSCHSATTRCRCSTVPPDSSV